MEKISCMNNEIGKLLNLGVDYEINALFLKIVFVLYECITGVRSVFTV